MATFISGKQLLTVHFPANRTTSCCWGGKNLDEMYVTCGMFGRDEKEIVETPLAGSIFRVKGLGFKGIPAYVYEG